MTHAAQNHAQRAATALFLRAAPVANSVDEEGRKIRFVASTDDIDGHGTIVKQHWQLDRFDPQGVVLYGHDYDELPIGTATVSVDGGKLMAEVTFSTEALNPRAEQVWQNVRAGVIRGISPGFIPHTITFERHDDREVMVLDDNELIELSITPCPSNAAALAQMRALKPAPEPTSPPGAAPTVPTGEEKPMAENTQPDPVNTVTVARALGLPAGATEQDVVTRSVSLREIEIQLLTLTGEKSLDAAIGAVRGMVGAAGKLKTVSEELAAVRAERDAQNFEALIAQGRADSKLSPAEERFEREEFERAVADGRGASAVERLGGMLKVKAADPRLVRTARQQPEVREGSGSPLFWNGKAYKDLKPAQRARLAAENPDLFRAMKEDHEAAGAAA